MGLLLHANSGTLMMRFFEKQPAGITLFPDFMDMVRYKRTEITINLT